MPEHPRRVLLDTDIASEILKRKDRVVLARATDYSAIHDAFTFTSVSVHEIVFGLTHKNATGQLRHALRVFALSDIQLPSEFDYVRSGEIRGLARRKGRQIETNDALIGAVAERLGLPVATGNVRHFQAMTDAGLRIDIEDWRRPILSA